MAVSSLPYHSITQVDGKAFEGTLPFKLNGTRAVFRLVQPENAKPPISVTELGISMLVSLSQSSNAEAPIEVTELGILMLVRLMQLTNADSPIEVYRLRDFYAF